MTEDQLRDLMRRVDDLTPPAAPDFAARAMDASARRVERRRTWGRAVLGAAAAIAIGTLAVTNLPRPSTSASSTAGVAARPEAATAGGSATDSGQGGSALKGNAATTPPGQTVTGPVTAGPTPPYTSAECAGTLTGVRAATPALQEQGFPIISAACDARGVVVVRMGTALTPEQRRDLTARYGAHVSVAGPDGTPLP